MTTIITSTGCSQAARKGASAAQPMGGEMTLQSLGETDLQPDLDGRWGFEPAGGYRLSL